MRDTIKRQVNDRLDCPVRLPGSVSIEIALAGYSVSGLLTYVQILHPSLEKLLS